VPGFHFAQFIAGCSSGHWFRLMLCTNKYYTWTLRLHRVMILPRETAFSSGGEHGIDANSMCRLWWEERRGSVTKRFLCIPVQSPYECKTRGEEQWHCPPRGEADAQTRKPCHAKLSSRAPSNPYLIATFLLRFHATLRQSRKKPSDPFPSPRAMGTCPDPAL
jgi:hypothetical protein